MSWTCGKVTRQRSQLYFQSIFIALSLFCIFLYLWKWEDDELQQELPNLLLAHFLLQLHLATRPSTCTCPPARSANFVFSAFFIPLFFKSICFRVRKTAVSNNPLNIKTSKREARENVAVGKSVRKHFSTKAYIHSQRVRFLQGVQGPKAPKTPS